MLCIKIKINKIGWFFSGSKSSRHFLKLLAVYDSPVVIEKYIQTNRITTKAENDTQKCHDAPYHHCHLRQQTKILSSFTTTLHVSNVRFSLTEYINVLFVWVLYFCFFFFVFLFFLLKKHFDQ